MSMYTDSWMKYWNENWFLELLEENSDNSEHK